MNRMPPAVEMDVVVGPKAEGARRATGAFGPTATSAATAPDPEVPAKAQRRRFTAEYRLRILKRADACKRPGELGALLRREGLYSSHLANWRRQREQGALRDMRGRRRGPTARPIDPRVKQAGVLESATSSPGSTATIRGCPGAPGPAVFGAGRPRVFLTSLLLRTPIRSR
jgi:transposase-like protein